MQKSHMKCSFIHEDKWLPFISVCWWFDCFFEHLCLMLFHLSVTPSRHRTHVITHRVVKWKTLTQHWCPFWWDEIWLFSASLEMWCRGSSLWPSSHLVQADQAFSFSLTKLWRERFLQVFTVTYSNNHLAFSISQPEEVIYGFTVLILQWNHSRCWRNSVN